MAAGDAEVCGAAERLMERHMQNYDCSHDMLHLNRVCRMAEKLAQGSAADMTIVRLGAIFHDAADHKYESVSMAEIASLMQQHCLSDKQIAEVVRIIESVGFTKEKTLRSRHEWTLWHETCIEFQCVQDADRLDAMGAIGMLRCAAYSCAANRPLIGGQASSAYDHIGEKLLLLRDTLKHPIAQELGRQRHEFMLAFQKQLELENDLLS